MHLPSMVNRGTSFGAWQREVVDVKGNVYSCSMISKAHLSLITILNSSRKKCSHLPIGNALSIRTSSWVPLIISGRLRKAPSIPHGSVSGSAWGWEVLHP